MADDKKLMLVHKQDNAATELLGTLIMALTTLKELAGEGSLKNKTASIISKLAWIQSIVCLVNLFTHIKQTWLVAPSPKTQSDDYATEMLVKMGYLENIKPAKVPYSVGDDEVPEVVAEAVRWIRVPASNFIDMTCAMSFIVNNTNVLHIVSTRDANMQDATEHLMEDIGSKKIYTPLMTVSTLNGDDSTIYAIKNKPFSDEFCLAVFVKNPDNSFTNVDRLAMDHAVFRKLHMAFLNSLKGKAIRIAEGDYYQSIVLSAVTLDVPVFYNWKVKDRIVDLIEKAIKYDESVTVFLYGYPGVGKTSAITKALSEVGLMPIYIDTSMRYDAVAHLLSADSRDRVLVLEEVTSIVGDDPEDINDRMTTILKILEARAFRAVLMTSNTTKVHPALARSGRSDIKILCDKPCLLDRKTICSGLSEKYEIPHDDDFIKSSAGCSHADLHNVFRYAKIEDKPLAIVLHEQRESDAIFKKFNPEAGDIDDGEDSDSKYD